MWGLAGSSSLFPALAYNAAKGAVVNLTRELGLEYARQGIQVNALCPGFYQTSLSRGAIDDPRVRAAITAFIPMGRIAEAAEIKGPALFLASAASDYMTGQTLVTDGGCLAK
jgi:NAD(P)-dependent dehydrogenase (short-subunit alcohol dehydrogenase family)